MQIQGIWDGFGINGTQINLYSTPGCPSATCSSGGGVTTGTGNSDYANTLGISGRLRFNSQKNGVLRLSVAESSIGKFDSYEGIYIQNLDINLPLGNLNYQPLILSTNSSGQVSLELARIPNVPAAYNQFYIDYGTSTALGTSGALTPAAGMCTGTSCPSTATHGNLTIGDVYVNNGTAVAGVTINGTTGYATMPNGDLVVPGGANALYTSTGAVAGSAVNGITFKAPGTSGSPTNGAAVNLGTAAISGLMINHMKMTLTGL